MTGGGDLPALGAGQAGEAPGAGRTPSRRALCWAQDLLSCPRLPSARSPGPGSLGWQRGSKLPACVVAAAAAPGLLVGTGAGKRLGAPHPPPGRGVWRPR